MSGAWHGAGRQHPPIRCHRTSEDVVMGRESSSNMAARTMEVQRWVEELQEKAESLAGGSRSRRRCKLIAEIGSLLSDQTLAENPSTLEGMCKTDGVAVKVIYSIFTSGSPHNLHEKVPRPVKTCLAQYLSSNKVYSHFGGSSGEQKRLSSAVLPLLMACSAILTHIEEKYLIAGLNVDSAKKKSPHSCTVFLLKTDWERYLKEEASMLLTRCSHLLRRLLTKGFFCEESLSGGHVNMVYVLKESSILKLLLTFSRIL